MPDEIEPVELTEPTDVIAWLRALPLWTVLLSLRDPQRPSCWQVRPWQEYLGLGASEFTALVAAGEDEAYELHDDEDVAMVALEGPFRVLWTPGGGM